eukprot:470358-Hanusia_phi.AAC.1
MADAEWSRGEEEMVRGREKAEPHCGIVNEANDSMILECRRWRGGGQGRGDNGKSPWDHAHEQRNEIVSACRLSGPCLQLEPLFGSTVRTRQPAASLPSGDPSVSLRMPTEDTRTQPEPDPPRRQAAAADVHVRETRSLLVRLNPVAEKCRMVSMQIHMDPRLTRCRNTEDKLKLADMLSTFGMNFIEGGWPSVNLVDEAFFKRARQELSPSCFQKLVAMAPVVEGVSEEEERRRAKDLLALNVRNLGLAATVLGADGNWVTKESVARLASHIRHVREWEKTTEGRLNIFVHLHNGFDAWRQDKLRLFNIISELQEAGADGLLIVDNGGIGTPWEIAELARELVQRKQARKETTWLGISCSDNLELAAASALYAAKEGMELVTGTVNGLEGTTDLTTVIPVLQLKMKLGLVESQALRSLTRLSRTVNEQMNLPHRSNQPFVGNSAFAHKGGIHVAAVLKNEDSYQHIDPTLVGNQRRVLISELSGRGNIMSKVEEFGMLGQQGGALKTGEKQGKDEEWKQRSGEILKSVKELERKGYTFEGAEASVDLMIRRSLPEYRPAFSVVEYQVYNYDIEPTMERVKRWRSGAAGDYFSKERKTAKCKAVVAVRVDQSV